MVASWTPFSSLLFPQTGVLTAPQVLALQTVTKLFQLASWLLLTAYALFDGTIADPVWTSVLPK